MKFLETEKLLRKQRSDINEKAPTKKPQKPRKKISPPASVSSPIASITSPIASITSPPASVTSNPAAENKTKKKKITIKKAHKGDSLDMAATSKAQSVCE